MPHQRAHPAAARPEPRQSTGRLAAIYGSSRRSSGRCAGFDRFGGGCLTLCAVPIPHATHAKPYGGLAPAMHGRDHLDTYLLRVLHTLLTEQSVTRTAVRLGQSQPAISNTLKRLREITGDAILVRGKSGMVPTERGRELLLLAEQSLAAMDRIARPP